MTTISETRDAVPSKETAYRMSVGDTFEGTLFRHDDIDWIGIELTGGTAGTISLSFSGSRSLWDVRLVLYDANEEPVAGLYVLNDGQSGSGELNFTLPDNSLDGQYYVGISLTLDFLQARGSSSYSVMVTATEASVPATMGDVCHRH